jgi:L-lactate dehydrogenase complex protein LldG
MSATTAKENILKKIRKALSNPVPLPFPLSEGSTAIYHPQQEELEVLFAQVFTGLQGKFAFCMDEQDMHQQLQHLIVTKQWTKIFCSESKWQQIFSNTISLETCDAAVTGCEYLIARTGSIVMSSAEQSGRTVSVYAPVHICIAYTNQLLYDVKDALQNINDKYWRPEVVAGKAGNFPSFITFASGPSRTADIEKTLVTGVHGPKEVYLFLVEGGRGQKV